MAFGRSMVYGKQQEGQRSAGCRAGEQERALIAQLGCGHVMKSLPPATAETTGMHWEAKWGEVVYKLEESRKAVT